MTKPNISNSFVGKMQRWMDSVPGQTFLNYAYSWGAAVVILGTLFKLTHLPGANLMLFLGMGTEVVVFFLSAFDRPFDKTSSNRELSEEYVDEVEHEHDEADEQSGGATIVGGGGIIGGGVIAGGGATGGGEGGGGTVVVGGGGGGGAVIIGGGGVAGAGVAAAASAGEAVEPSATEQMQTIAQRDGITPESLIEIIRLSNEELLRQAQQAVSPEMEEAAREYTEKLNTLTETLDRIEKQSARLTTDSEEMTNLNRTLTGINTVYELQLKSVSQQITSIERINEQTRKMAEQIEELNGVYARMIKALTVNMRNAAATTGADFK